LAEICSEFDDLNLSEKAEMEFYEIDPRAKTATKPRIQWPRQMVSKTSEGSRKTACTKKKKNPAEIWPAGFIILKAFSPEKNVANFRNFDSY
jgi:hypothetical protein